MRLLAGITALGVIAIPASAEPTGRWFSGFGQGAMEYGIKNDSAGSDYFHVACPNDGAKISFTVGGKNPAPKSKVIVVVGGDEFELLTDERGRFQTTSHVAYDTFRSLWASIRAGDVMRVRLSTGQSAAFTLKGAAKVLPRAQCKAGT